MPAISVSGPQGNELRNALGTEPRYSGTEGLVRLATIRGDHAIAIICRAAADLAAIRAGEHTQLLQETRYGRRDRHGGARKYGVRLAVDSEHSAFTSALTKTRFAIRRLWPAASGDPSATRRVEFRPSPSSAR
jgi:hypothetical protein